MIKKFFLQTGDNNKVFVNIRYTKPYSKKCAIFCHGMLSSKDGIKAKFLTKNLALCGWNTVRFDFRYSGQSSGDIEDITISGEKEDLSVVYDFLLKEGFEYFLLIGSSLGGTVASTFASENNIHKLVLIAPPFNFKELLNKWFSGADLEKIKSMGYFLMDNVRINYDFVEDALNYDFNDVLSKIKCGTVLIHGDCDEIVPLNNSELAASLLPNVENLNIIKHGGHRLNNELDEILKIITNFINS